MFARGPVSNAREDSVSKMNAKGNFFSKKKRCRGFRHGKKRTRNNPRPHFFSGVSMTRRRIFRGSFASPIGAVSPWRPVAMSENSAAGFQPNEGEGRYPEFQASTKRLDRVARFPAIVLGRGTRAAGGTRGLRGGAFGGRYAAKMVLESGFGLLPPPGFSAIEYSLVRKNGLSRRLTDLRRQRGRCIL